MNIITAMDETTYQQWWSLHLRVARGESLTAEEQAVYQEGLRCLHQEESVNGDIATLRQVRATVAALEAKHAHLHARRDKLEAEITVLEAALSDRTRQLLAVGD